MEFAYDGGGLAKGGNGLTTTWTARRSAKAVSIRPSRWAIPPTRPATSATTVGSPVTYDYPEGITKFSGEVNWVEIDLGKNAVDLDHLISPEERLRVAMAIQ